MNCLRAPSRFVMILEQLDVDLLKLQCDLCALAAAGYVEMVVYAEEGKIRYMPAVETSTGVD